YNSINHQALIIGLVSLAILIFWPKIPKIGAKVPASLIAVLVSIGLVKGVGVDAKTIGDLYEIPTGFPAFSFPAITFAKVRAVIGDSFTIAILAAIESLLSCVVADGMINSHHRSNQELIAQGAGNIGSALFGGIPATGAIARTAANIKNGGRTPIAGMFHAVVLVLVVLFLMPYASLIPMPTIAAILFQVAYNMSGWRTFKHLCKTAPKSDILVLFTTFILTVVFDLVVAIGVGMVLACVLLMKRMADETSVKGWKYIDPDNDPDSIELRKVPESVRVYEISGPMFFGATEALMDITVKDFTKVLVIRMRAVPALDASAMHSLEGLYERCEKKGVRMVFSHVNEQPMKTMVKDGFVKLIGEENFCPHIDDALRRAEELAK
ncbi:MAG: STAS domain-containing protein, partial [Lachnospiraceae bacterium]|nr:STAS domain-containing protein [Lachnospiraceae bacterium]